jgi:putative membrane protein
MGDYLIELYPWLKVGHIISIITWMAGIFYLPRLFVHHSESVAIPSATDVLFKMMERKLLYVIMTPAMFASWGFGTGLAVIPGAIDWSLAWPWAKLLSILCMTAFHFWLMARQKAFEQGKNKLRGRTYRIMNEVPTALLLVIVIMVIVRPF